ncbi:hypothetical protein KSP40_PGU005828 [Platanthera guangdongensis]|uniref:Uncharacterized protein n=1 Tax=Platanthera guangdongensis TaxID=2320717 RepID=A0ABR2MT96_9ASPA
MGAGDCYCGWSCPCGGSGPARPPKGPSSLRLKGAGRRRSAGGGLPPGAGTARPVQAKPAITSRKSSVRRRFRW